MVYEQGLATQVRVALRVAGKLNVGIIYEYDLAICEM